MVSNNELARGPLDGVRVVEVGVWHAGPGASAILADLGAEVIKVETFTGDPERHNGDFGPVEKSRFDEANWSLLFEMSNRNKSSICIDLAKAEGHELLAELLRDADIFVTNLRPSTKLKLKIDYQSISQIRPDIIHVNVSGFGSEGPMADSGAFDLMGQAISGMLYLLGRDEPTPQQIILLDQLTAITASHAALAALAARDRGQGGQEVHASLYGSATWLMYANLLVTSVEGREIDVSWDRTKNQPLRTSYRCGDGQWIIGTSHPEEKYWSQFCSAINRPDMASNPEYAAKAARAKRRPEIIAELDELLLTKPRDEWLRIFEAHGIFFAPVRHLTDVLNDEQALVNGFVKEFDHPRLGRAVIPGYPVKFGRSSAGIRTGAPDLGGDADAILSSRGFSPEQIDRLCRAGVVRRPDLAV